LVLFSPDSAEADIGCGGKLNAHLMASCVRNNPVNNCSKFDNSSLSYNQKCPGCFFPDMVYKQSSLLQPSNNNLKIYIYILELSKR